MMQCTYGAGRAHREHGGLIWIAERAIQIKSRLNGTTAGKYYGINPCLFTMRII